MIIDLTSGKIRFKFQRGGALWIYAKADIKVYSLRAPEPQLIEVPDARAYQLLDDTPARNEDFDHEVAFGQWAVHWPDGARWFTVLLSRKERIWFASLLTRGSLSRIEVELPNFRSRFAVHEEPKTIWDRLDTETDGVDTLS